MWVWRKKWEALLVESATAKGKVGQLEATLRTVTSRLVTRNNELKAALARVRELEAAVLDYNDKLVSAKKETAGKVEVPNVIEDLFSEDEQEVEKDREFIAREGTSDPLFVETEQ